MRGNDSPMNHLGTAKPMVHYYRLEIRYRRKMPPHSPEKPGECGGMSVFAAGKGLIIFGL